MYEGYGDGYKQYASPTYAESARLAEERRRHAEAVSARLQAEEDALRAEGIRPMADPIPAFRARQERKLRTRVYWDRLLPDGRRLRLEGTERGTYWSASLYRADGSRVGTVDFKNFASMKEALEAEGFQILEAERR